MTNFERITESPEALADVIDRTCPPVECESELGKCRQCWLDWLNSEAEVVNDDTQ